MTVTRKRIPPRFEVIRSEDGIVWSHVAYYDNLITAEAAARIDDKAELVELAPRDIKDREWPADISVI